MRRALATATLAGALALVPAAAPSALAAESSTVGSPLAQSQEEGNDEYGDYGLIGLLGLLGLFGYRKYKDHRAATRDDGTDGSSRRV
jgi:hypothetical protein